jgi:hypothetical protein
VAARDGAGAQDDPRHAEGEGRRQTVNPLHHGDLLALDIGSQRRPAAAA